MAFGISRLLGITSNFGTRHWVGTNVNAVNLVNIAKPQLVLSRSSSFFNRKPFHLLWKSATSVSNPGKKRGRGKNVQKKANIYDLIGYPVPTMQFPGLHSPIKKGNMFVTQRPLAPTDTLRRSLKRPKQETDFEENVRINMNLSQRPLGPTSTFERIVPRTIQETDFEKNVKTNMDLSERSLDPTNTLESIVTRTKQEADTEENVKIDMDLSQSPLGPTNTLEGTVKGTKQETDFEENVKINMNLSQRPLGPTNTFEGTVKSTQQETDFGENVKMQMNRKPIHKSKLQIKMVPLRGWTSATIKGKKLGPPDPTEKESFEGFESWILENRVRTTMHPTLGRVKTYYVCCVTGNGNGTAGFADVDAKSSQTVIGRGKNAAGQRLLTIDRYEDRTVLHDFFARFGNSKIIVKQAPAGHGLVCHRALKACCEAFGIKDIYAKSEGSDNVPYLVQAFFIGLLKQKSFREMAEDKKLHVVEFRSENYFFPKVLASPSTVRTNEEIPYEENLDFNQYLLDGKVPLIKKRPDPFYINTPSYDRYLRKLERRRGQEDVRIKLKAQYGEMRSFLTEKYPEAKPVLWRKKQAELEDAEEY